MLSVPPIDLCINTQTPLLQFATHLPGSHLEREWPSELELPAIAENEECHFSPGGVTRMVLPLVRWMVDHGIVRTAHWIALNPVGPRVVRTPGLVLHNLGIPSERMSAYSRTKEAIWAAAHGTGEIAPSQDLFWSEEFSEYAYYNRRTAEYLRQLDRREDFDLFYIHDFQQLQVGAMLDTLKPKLFRWHIPFEKDAIPPEWSETVLRCLRSYDTIVVSSERYKQELRRFGHRGRIERLYPYVDPAEYARPGPPAVAAALAKWSIPPGDVIALVVGRMDPTKGQDRTIRALARVAPRFPECRLVLAGNGSFSSSAGGLGLNKSARWRAELERLAAELNVAGRVLLTGHVTQAELDALYERAAFTMLPSVREGFGLVVVESWIHERPAIVSRAAGVAELVKDGQNGIVVDPDDTAALADGMARLLRDEGSLREKLARGSRDALAACSFEGAMRDEARLIQDLVA